MCTAGLPAETAGQLRAHVVSSRRGPASLAAAVDGGELRFKFVGGAHMMFRQRATTKNGSPVGSLHTDVFIKAGICAAAPRRIPIRWAP